MTKYQRKIDNSIQNRYKLRTTDSKIDKQKFIKTGNYSNKRVPRLCHLNIQGAQIPRLCHLNVQGAQKMVKERDGSPFNYYYGYGYQNMVSNTSTLTSDAANKVELLKKMSKLEDLTVPQILKQLNMSPLQKREFNRFFDKYRMRTNDGKLNQAKLMKMITTLHLDGKYVMQLPKTQTAMPSNAKNTRKRDEKLKVSQDIDKKTTSTETSSKMSILETDIEHKMRLFESLCEFGDLDIKEIQKELEMTQSQINDFDYFFDKHDLRTNSNKLDKKRLIEMKNMLDEQYPEFCKQERKSDVNELRVLLKERAESNKYSSTKDEWTEYKQLDQKLEETTGTKRVAPSPPLQTAYEYGSQKRKSKKGATVVVATAATNTIGKKSARKRSAVYRQRAYKEDEPDASPDGAPQPASSKAAEHVESQAPKKKKFLCDFKKFLFGKKKKDQEEETQDKAIEVVEDQEPEVPLTKDQLKEKKKQEKREAALAKKQAKAEAKAAKAAAKAAAKNKGADPETAQTPSLHSATQEQHAKQRAQYAVLNDDPIPNPTKLFLKRQVWKISKPYIKKSYRWSKLMADNNIDVDKINIDAVDRTIINIDALGIKNKLMRKSVDWLLS